MLPDSSHISSEELTYKTGGFAFESDFSESQNIFLMNQISEELITEMKSTTVDYEIKKIVKIFLYDRNWFVDFRDIGSWFLLAWYSLYYRTGIYIYFGVCRGY